MEKDYVNSWILYTIYQHTELDQSLVFKGGTALSKLYFPEIWRFSEDLDFTATENQLQNVQDRIQTGLDNGEQESGITFEITNVHRAGEPVAYIQLDVQYDAVLGQQNTTTLDITFGEPLMFETRSYRHSYEDVPEFNVTAYSVEEIFVEKLRSLFQRARARDYYDLYRLLQQESFNDQKILNALIQKCRAQEVELDLENGLSRRDVEDVRDYWDRSLDRLVTEKPPFDEVVNQIEAYLDTLSRL